MAALFLYHITKLVNFKGLARIPPNGDRWAGDKAFQSEIGKNSMPTEKEKNQGGETASGPPEAVSSFWHFPKCSTPAFGKKK